MDEGKISVRYAKALLSLANEKKVTEAVRIDIVLINQLFETIPGFFQLLESPVIGTKEKQQLFKEVFAESLNPMTYSFLILLLTNHRETYLRDISRYFLESYRKETGLKAANLISAVEIDPATVEQFRALIRKHFDSEVDLTFKVDPKIIGGFILQVEDQQIDASVAAKLKKLKRELLESQI
jgi:F-type H+-transporting ATPase subunit delta